MFILPPPPKYYNTGTTLQGLQSALEAVNSLTTLDESHDIVAPEGTYKALDCIFLATPLPHPSDPPPPVVNPLAPTGGLPSTHSSGTRLSVIPAPRGGRTGSLSSSASGSDVSSSSVGTARTSFGSNTSKSFGWRTSLFKGRSDQTELDSDLTGLTRPGRQDSVSSAVSSSFGSTLSHTLSLSSNNGPKKSRPKSHLTKNNSSFVSRAIVHESFSKRMSERTSDDIYIWANVGRSISWLDSCTRVPPSGISTGTNHKNVSLNITNKHEPMVKVLFTKSHPLCHDINQLTVLPTSLDLAVGSSSGDILWIEPVSNRYNRINKNGDVTRAAITDIKWIPGSENLFIAGTSDGHLIIFDKEREDGGFAANGGLNEQSPKSTETFKILRSYSNGSKQNPIAVYKVSNRPLTNLTFSPGGDVLAFTSKDEYMRFIDLNTESLMNIFPSYYAGLLCCEFSPDGLYIATGGQDDLISIWSVNNKCLMARLQGHASWVRRVLWDPYCPNQYRLGSVGEDGNLLLWDFSPKTVARRIKRAINPQRPGHSRTVSEISTESEILTTEVDISESPKSDLQDVLIPFVSNKDVPIIPPVVTTSVHVSKAEPEPLSDLCFTENTIVASGKDGRIWTWQRPEEEEEEEEMENSEF